MDLSHDSARRLTSSRISKDEPGRGELHLDETLGFMSPEQSSKGPTDKTWTTAAANQKLLIAAAEQEKPSQSHFSSSGILESGR